MTMVERVARAICARNWDGDSARYDDLNDSQRADFLADARAAIEALREPSEGMIDAACSASVLPDEASDEELALDYWHAVIDAILAEQPNGQQAV